MSDEWVIRAGVPEDESCVAAMWLRALCQSRTALELGFERAREPGSDDQIAWWAMSQPFVTALVRSAAVTVLCDPERSEHGPGTPAILWGWLVASGDVVFGCGVKNSARGAGVGRDVARALLGDRLERPQVQALELVDLQRLKLVPDIWTVDGRLWATMRHLAEIALEPPDSVVRLVASHVGDPRREQWVPNSLRATVRVKAA